MLPTEISASDSVTSSKRTIPSNFTSERAPHYNSQNVSSSQMGITFADACAAAEASSYLLLGQQFDGQQPSAEALAGMGDNNDDKEIDLDVQHLLAKVEGGIGADAVNILVARCTANTIAGMVTTAGTTDLGQPLIYLSHGVCYDCDLETSITDPAQLPGNQLNM